jgi:hypothetical protein
LVIGVAIYIRILKRQTAGNWGTNSGTVALEWTYNKTGKMPVLQENYQAQIILARFFDALGNASYQPGFLMRLFTHFIRRYNQSKV